jgi:3-hydroxyacyl-CoA dehydrogenase, NAD binding domain
MSVASVIESIICVWFYQVAAQTGHHVTLVDVSENLLKNSKKNIETSVTRVAKKRFANDTQVIMCLLCLPKCLILDVVHRQLFVYCRME